MPAKFVRLTSSGSWERIVKSPSSSWGGTTTPALPSRKEKPTMLVIERLARSTKKLGGRPRASQLILG